MEPNHGLNPNIRNFVVLCFFLILLIWGPIEPYGVVARIAYLVTLPILLWLALSYFGSKWKGGSSANNRLARGIAGIIAGVLFMSAYLSFTAPYHTKCTQYAQTTDGSECVGDYIKVRGGDLLGTILFVGLGALATWYAVSKHKGDEAG